MYRKINKRTILKRAAAIIMMLVLVLSDFSIHNTGNMFTVNAKQSQVVFRYGDMQEIKIGAYKIIQEYKKDTSQKKFTIKVKKGNKILLKARVGYALLLDGKLYYAERNCIYCYNVKKEKSTVLVEVPKIEEEWYTDIDISQYYYSYLYYIIDMGASVCALYRVNIKTGKIEELMECLSYKYDFFYKGYTYIPFGDHEISNQSYYRISLKGKKKVKEIISKCADGNVVRYKNKLYYMQFGKINYNDTSKVTTYLKCCNLDGSHKKTLKTWKKQTMEVMGIIDGVLYFRKANEFKSEFKTLYKYNIKSKKITTTKKYPKVKKIKLKSLKGKGICKVTWDRVMENWDDSYEISYATNPQFHNEKIKKYDYDDRMSSLIKLKSQVAVIKGLKKGKTYYVRIRAKEGYSENCIYSPYSKTMKIKIQ